MRIRHNDTVEVLSGEDRGKKGRVLAVFPGRSRAIVEGVNFIKRHTKPNRNNPKGGIVEKEASVHLSNLMLICPKCNTRSKVRADRAEGGSRVRVCRSCGEVIGTSG
ncbi:MAG: 50S ribosomal protein L24 [Candidatus Handelsmanbacteria bacterium RIFCSPLOWO2_12_FULL_64_10]|uniref:Large ribosomal subunit protein uL24 n=1 Tax=Handelsmanbacteria sp. (strain RIFCSPLOWO2_12_FULL_64_10) TaxID=1817868 RepID=A0A1F6C8W6_HANXR|nr:MAG: 50S ribosomal protein L24 [Candidatus Handelsmanbacteria bacterium RIFCSPLOWO2_12_FULL_64_10]